MDAPTRALTRLLRRSLPLAITAVALGVLLRQVSLAKLASVLTGDALLFFLPPLLVYGALSLWIEAVSLRRLLPVSGHPALGTWTCARIKAATYPLALLHYALGGAALTLLLRRRAGLRVADAAGMVLLLAVLDLGVLLALTAVGAAWLQAEGPAVQAGVVVILVTGILLGMVLVRTDVPLGPLDRLRELDVFRAARHTSMPVLAELLALRLLFVCAFIGLAGAALHAFDLSVPLGSLVVNWAAVSLVAVLPIAVAGLGTGQAAFVYLFGEFGSRETLLACSLTISAGLILMRVAMGLAFAREFTREALAAVHEEEA